MPTYIDCLREMPCGDMATELYLEADKTVPAGSELQLFTCYDRDGAHITEKPPPAEESKEVIEGVRSFIVTSYDIGKALYKHQLLKKFESLAALLWYATVRPTQGGKRGMRKPNIDPRALAASWVEVIARLAVSHTKDDLDRSEARLDEILTPILSAPVAQLREFFPLMVAGLKADERVPFFVWRTFEVWAQKEVEKAPDEDVILLRTALAREIVDLLSPDVEKDLMEAMVNALQWRSAEKLQEVKDALVFSERTGGRAAARVRTVGHESCLFLEVENPAGERIATVQI